MQLVGFAFTATALAFLSTVPHKIRRQIIKKAKALHTNPFPPGVKKLEGVTTDSGEPVYRERSGDYRILYVVIERPREVLILDIGNRKDVYDMAKTKQVPAEELRMKESDFDEAMRSALGVAPPPPSSPGKPKAKSGQKKAAQARR